MSKQERRTAEQLCHTAIHEAGHAVIQRVIGMICGEVSIVPNYKTMEGGYSTVAGPYVVLDAWERRGKLRGEQWRSIMRGRIMGYMAGREAEIIAFGNHGGADGDDLLQITLMADDANISEADLERLRPKARGLLRRHWKKVDAVADALLGRKTLSGAKVDAIIKNVTPRRERAIAKRVTVAQRRLSSDFLAMLAAEKKRDSE
jgi:ATP-dependent Zn protease